MATLITLAPEGRNIARREADGNIVCLKGANLINVAR